MRLLLFVILLFFLPLGAFAQDTETQTAFPDTIKPTAIDFLFTTRADTFKGDTLFHLKQGGYVLKSEEDYSTVIHVFVKSKKGYKVFNGCNEDATMASEYSFEEANFDGTGQDELVVQWSYRWGHGGLHGGNYSDYEGIFIWNLDEMELIYAFNNIYIEESSYTEFALDSLGNEYDSIISSSSYSDCSAWTVSYSLKKLSLAWDTRCEPTDEQGNDLPKPKETEHVYELVGDNLILEK